ncbi:MAG: MerR family transcriptional regulator [Lachnospiraceae bacterium]|nr:MerR family transcriptional regulator [Lachnospiraceae bacterium]
MSTYTIKELSKLFDVQSSTLRYYEDIGLLTNVGRTDTNQRIYTDEHIARLNAISCFKNTGLPISKMQDFFKYEANLENNIDEIIDLVTEHEKNIKEQIKKMQDELAHIEHKVRFYNGIKEAIDKNAPWPYWDDYNI